MPEDEASAYKETSVYGYFESGVSPSRQARRKV